MSLLPCLLFSLLLLSIRCYSSPTCTPFMCGSINISYPFSSYDPKTDKHCGYPGLLISCEDSNAILHLQNDTYTVQDIDYDNHTITLVDTEIFRQNATCPRVQNNVSFFVDSGIQYTSSDENLTFFFDCSTPLNESPIACLTGVFGGSSYVFRTSDIDPVLYTQWSSWCHLVVVAPVLEEYLIQYYKQLFSDFGLALSKGFQLGWNSTANCTKCQEEGGQCGYTLAADNTTYVFNCFCANGTCGTFLFYDCSSPI